MGFDPARRAITRPLQDRRGAGFFAVLSAPTLEEARATVERGAERLEVFDLDIVPVNQFPHFAS
jgi:hypothetical protein